MIFVQHVLCHMMLLAITDDITLAVSIYRALNMDRWKAQTHTLEERLYAWSSPLQHVTKQVSHAASISDVSEYNLSQLYIRCTTPSINIFLSQTQYAFLLHVIEENLKVRNMM